MSATSPIRPDTQNGRRSNSFVGNFIKRTRSTDLLGERKTSNNNFARNRVLEGEEETQSPTAGEAPMLPTVAPHPRLQTFGGDNHVPVMEAPQARARTIASPIAHTRAESMTHRGRGSYAISTNSSVNSPRRMKRKKDPISYNVLVIGARNSGKTSFINFLKSSIAPDATQQNVRNPELDLPPPSARTNPGSFVQHYLELEIEDEKVGLSIWDSQGFEKNIVDLQLHAMNNFVESKFEDTFIEEMKVVRSPGYRDTHIHCVFFLFDPAQLDLNIRSAQENTQDSTSSYRAQPRVIGALDEDFELQILKSLQGKTTVIPVISKADTVTAPRMEHLKKMVGESFQKAGLDPLEALHFEHSDNEDDTPDEFHETAESTADSQLEAHNESQSVTHENGETPDQATPVTTEADNSDGDVTPELPAITKKSGPHRRQASKVSVSTVMFDNGYMPMSILSPDDHSVGGSDGPVGRRYPWGFADPYNPQHSDFVKLKETCFTEWRADFKETSREVFYERWRTGRLNRGPPRGFPKASSKPVAPVRKPSGGIPIELSSKTKKYT